MRRDKINMQLSDGAATDCIIEYPDEVAFVFNPLVISLKTISETPNREELSVLVEDIETGATRSLEVDMYHGTALIYYSRLAELFFDDIKHKRVRYLRITLQTKQDSRYLFSFKHTMVWGANAVGVVLNEFGIRVDRQGESCIERRRIWFKGYPFTVSLFQPESFSEGESISAWADNRTDEKTNCVFVPRFDGVIDSSIGSAAYDIKVGNENEDIKGVVFDTHTNSFYGKTQSGSLVKQWQAKLPFYYGSEAYIKEDGTPKQNAIWGCSATGRFYCYDNQLGGLRALPNGHYGSDGIFELHPEHCFSNAKRHVTYRQDIPMDRGRMSVFDGTFDFTFANFCRAITTMPTITRVQICEYESGYYMRWIDRFGCYQYYLFIAGETTVKTKLSGLLVADDDMIGGMTFPNHSRDMQISATDTRRGMAHSLEDDIYAYVSTIVTSPIIDLYLGKGDNGIDIWLPVTISASSHKYKPREARHNLEISFAMPDIQAQRL